LTAAHGLPCRLGLRGAFGIVVDRKLGPDGGGRFEEICAEETWLDDRGVDAEGLDLEADGLHPAFHPELGRGVGGAELLPHESGHRTERHDVTGALLAHHGKYGARDVHRAEQVRADLTFDLLLADLLKKARLEVARVVDEHIDPPEALPRRLDGVLRADGVGDVELHHERLVVSADRSTYILDVAASGHDRVPCGEGGLGELHSHATSGACDEPHLAGRHVRRSPSRCCSKRHGRVSLYAAP
jgi:hypothetical protein